MGFLCAGLASFFLVHVYGVLRTHDPEKDIKYRLGEGTYKGVFSLVSGTGLALAIYGYAIAPRGPALYTGPALAQIAAFVGVGAAFILIAAAYTPSGYLKRFIEHPMVLGVGLWAVAHLATGADLKKALFFGAFAFFSTIYLITPSRRTKTPPPTRATLSGDLMAIVIGLGLYGAMVVWGHGVLFARPLI